MIRVRLAATAALLLLAFASSACGGGPNPNGPDPSAGFALRVPQTIAGLNVQQDAKSTATLNKQKGKETYVKDGSVYTLRVGTGSKAELKAVLQVIRLTPDARPEDPEFRRTIACLELPGGTCRTPELINGAIVYQGVQAPDTKFEQKIYLWFTGRFMQTLQLPKDTTGAYDPQLLLNQVVAIKPVRAA